MARAANPPKRNLAVLFTPGSATQPAQPFRASMPPGDSLQSRVKGHNQLPRRDPTGARGNRDPRPVRMSERDKTRR